MYTTCSECVADVYVGVKTHLCYVRTCSCTGTQNTCKEHVTLTAKKNVHIYIFTHICIRMHMHTKTYAHAWHRPHAEALIPRPTIYAQICIYIYIYNSYLYILTDMHICVCIYVYDKGLWSLFDFLLPLSDPTGISFTVQKSIPWTFCTFAINRLQTNVRVTVLVTKLGTKNYGSSKISTIKNYSKHQISKV